MFTKFIIKKDTGMVLEKQLGDVCDSWTQMCRMTGLKHGFSKKH